MISTKASLLTLPTDPDIEGYNLSYPETALGFALESIACSSSKVDGNNGEPYNCYAYAIQENPHLRGFVQSPGTKNGGASSANITEVQLHNSIIADGGQLFEWPKDRELPHLYGSGNILVASFIYSYADPDVGIEAYWHFMRQGPFGLWYEKEGMDGQVRQAHTKSGRQILDPREAENFCALYIFP